MFESFYLPQLAHVLAEDLAHLVLGLAELLLANLPHGGARKVLAVYIL